MRFGMVNDTGIDLIEGDEYTLNIRTEKIIEIRRNGKVIYKRNDTATALKYLGFLLF